MRDRNKTYLVGNLGSAPEIRDAGNSGYQVAVMSLCTTRYWTGSDGQPQEKKNWHRVEVWSSLESTFNFVRDYLGKGDRIDVEGEIDYSSYQRDGQTVWRTVIRADEIRGVGKLTGPKARAGGERAQGQQAEKQLAGAGAGGGRGGGAYDDFQAPPFEDDDDLPF